MQDLRPNPNLLGQNEVEAGTLRAELGDPHSRAVGEIRTELHTKTGLEVASDKQGMEELRPQGDLAQGTRSPAPGNCCFHPPEGPCGYTEVQPYPLKELEMILLV